MRGSWNERLCYQANRYREPVFYHSEMVTCARVIAYCGYLAALSNAVLANFNSKYGLAALSHTVGILVFSRFFTATIFRRHTNLTMPQLNHAYPTGRLPCFESSQNISSRNALFNGCGRYEEDGVRVHPRFQ